MPHQPGREATQRFFCSQTFAYNWKLRASVCLDVSAPSAPDFCPPAPPYLRLYSLRQYLTTGDFSNRASVVARGAVAQRGSGCGQSRVVDRKAMERGSKGLWSGAPKG